MVNALRAARGAWIIAWMLLWLGPAHAAIDVQVTVNPDPPVAGESFRIAFEVKGDLQHEPDFSPLEQRFDVVGRNRQTSLQWVNGRHTRTTTFILEVLAKPGAPLELPSIAFDDVTTRARRITAAEAPAPQASTYDGLFLEVDASPRNPYVQQQVIFTIRLWRRYELSNASLSQPRLRTDAIVRPLGEDRQYEAERDGRRYEVVERRFALFPQTSGATVIEPVTVTAQVLERASSLFEMFGRAVKTRRISSAPVALEVRAIPAEFPTGATWLPASKVRLNELWEPEDARVKAGDPATRTLSLWASGQTSGQLPELAAPDVPGLKAYPDQPQLQEDAGGAGISAVRQEKVALIPEGAGSLSIPGIALPWWNIETDALEYARVPARALHAFADPATSRPAETSAPAAAPAAVPAAQASSPSPAAAPVTDWRHWPGWFVLSCGLLVAWPVSLIWVSRRRGPQGDVAAVNSAPGGTAATARRALLDACARHDPRAARAALCDWANAQLPGAAPWTLDALVRESAPPLADAIRTLDTALYGRDQPPWRGDTLAAAFGTHAPAPTPSRHAVDPLPKIFRLAS